MRARHPIRRATSKAKKKGKSSSRPAKDPYATLLRLLVAERESRKMKQADLGDLIGRKQAGVAKIEAGIRRLDPIELFVILDAMKVDVIEFVAKLRRQLKRGR